MLGSDRDRQTKPTNEEARLRGRVGEGGVTDG